MRAGSTSIPRAWKAWRWVTDDFAGYAWGETLRWIHFNGSGGVSYPVSMLIYRLYLALVMREGG